MKDKADEIKGKTVTLKWVPIPVPPLYVNIFKLFVAGKPNSRRYLIMAGVIDPQLEHVIINSDRESYDVLPSVKLILDEDGFGALWQAIKDIRGAKPKEDAP